MLSSKRALRKAFDKLALEDQEDDDDWQRGQEGAAEHDAVLEIVRSYERSQAEICYEHRGIGSYNKRPDKIVPESGKGENTEYGQSGTYQRNHDAPPDIELTCTINTRS